jgi:molybdenum cofactor biosynthesis enzyme MoaA
LDTLDPFKFELMVRRPAAGHTHVLGTLEDAVAMGHRLRVKMNVVVIRGLNDTEVLDFVGLTQERAVTVRFIEYMPFSGGSLPSWRPLSYLLIP